MPSTVADLFAAADLASCSCVAWGEPLPVSEPGIYVVALTAETSSLAAARADIPLSDAALATLLARPALRVDGRAATRATLAARLAACWLPDEVVVYVGLSSRPLAKRVREYYVTPLGARSRHAGGWPLKTLSVPLSVHYAPTPRFAPAEQRMLDAFATATSEATRARLHDWARPIPFANLRWLGHGRKRHGIDGACG
jgi:hypothetical protein